VYVQQRLSEARQLVVEHQTSIEWVAGALLKKGTLTGGEVRAIVAAAKRSA
jgi:ATP-dependent Zn protease